MVLISATLPYGDNLNSLNFYFNRMPLPPLPIRSRFHCRPELQLAVHRRSPERRRLEGRRLRRFLVGCHQLLPLSDRDPLLPLRRRPPRQQHHRQRHRDRHHRQLRLRALYQRPGGHSPVHANVCPATLLPLPSGEISSSTPALSSDSVTYYKRYALVPVPIL